MTTQSDQRVAGGLTQEQAARLAGVSVASWRRWERDPDSVSANVKAACEPVLERTPKRARGTRTQFTIDLKGVPPLGENDYVGFLQQPSGSQLVFIQREGEHMGTLLAGEDGDWMPIPIRDDRPLPLTDDRDRLWLGTCWHHSSELRPQELLPARSLEEYMAGRPMPTTLEETCKHCRQPIRALDYGETPTWTHTDDRLSRGCRAASWVPGKGRNDSLDSRWKATPEE